MKFTIDAKVFDVRFYREEKKRKNKMVIDTSCQISREEDVTPICIGVTHQSPRDNYSKRIGRKIAFTRALMDLKKYRFTRYERILFWERYKENFKLA